IARINANGTLDASFNPGSGANQRVEAIVVQPDGKILIGGVFQNFNGSGRNRIARLNANGTVDTGFVPGTGA
ncbi:MAG TPA: delta-60 repeat domain-containing protein, partial [Flavobacteriales bacterium]|nr:delta-60 repeat domain-containing protein [Flavobacteriales bacterium]